MVSQNAPNTRISVVLVPSGETIRAHLPADEIKHYKINGTTYVFDHLTFKRNSFERAYPQVAEIWQKSPEKIIRVTFQRDYLYPVIKTAFEHEFEDRTRRLKSNTGVIEALVEELAEKED